MKREIIATDRAPAAVGPYSQAVRVGDFIFTAGQIGVDPATGKLRSSVEDQTRQILANLQAVLTAAGSGLDQIIKTTIFLVDIADFASVNAVYGEVFPNTPPARSTVQVAALPLGALVEIEAIALTRDQAR
ncbi:MAG: RidA family protein [Anaerolineae bacterium]|nr:RidA family protein [Anaerolineae bacterium]